MEAVHIQRWQSEYPLSFLSGIHSLVVDSEANGFRMLRRLYDDWQSGSNRFHLPGEAIFVAIDSSGAIVAVGGLNQDPSGAAGVGRVRRVYVHSGFRNRGIGKYLLHASLSVLKESGLSLVTGMTRANTAAARYVYPKFGGKSERV
jgi:GNAT superfamily N-acetyltransferase